MWLRQVQNGSVQDDPAVSQADWHDTRDVAEALKRSGWGDSGQYRCANGLAALPTGSVRSSHLLIVRLLSWLPCLQRKT